MHTHNLLSKLHNTPHPSPSLYVRVHVNIVLTDINSVSKVAKGFDAILHMVCFISRHGDFGLSDSDSKQHFAEAPFHTSAVDLLLVSAACIFVSHPYAA